MAGNYAQFTVYDQDEFGINTNVGSGVSVVLYNLTVAATPAESPLTTIANGVISASSLAAGSPGDIVQFCYLKNGIGTNERQQLT